MTRVNQGLFSTTMEAEKRDPGNEVGSNSSLYFIRIGDPNELILGIKNVE